MRGEIQAFTFGINRNTQTDQLVDDEEGNARDQTGPDDGGDDPDGLYLDLSRDGVTSADAVGYVVPYAGTTQIWGGEDAGQQGTEDTADTMNTKDVQ